MSKKVEELLNSDAVEKMAEALPEEVITQFSEQVHETVAQVITAIDSKTPAVQSAALAEVLGIVAAATEETVKTDEMGMLLIELSSATAKKTYARLMELSDKAK